MTNAARRELVQKCRCIPYPTRGRKPGGQLCHAAGAGRCIPYPTRGRKPCVKVAANLGCAGMYPLPHTGTETQGTKSIELRLLKMQPHPHPGTETLRRISGRASPMHPQPHPGTETVRNHTRQIEARHDASPTPAPPPWDRHAHRCNPTPTRGRNHRTGTDGRIPACACCMIGI